MNRSSILAGIAATILLPAELIAESSATFAPVRAGDLLRVGPTLLVGPTPDGDAMRRLHRLGVCTLVSVDGMRPEVELATKHGLRYVHIPIGYDGVPREAALALTRVARDAEGAVYVHCHHGKHRGPAAAAIIGRVLGEIKDDDAAQRLLANAGTDRRFETLRRDATTFRPPAAGVELPELVAVASVDPLAAAMAAADRAWASLDEPTEQDRPNASLLVREALRESTRAARRRTPANHRLVARFEEAEAAALLLEQATGAEAVRKARATLAGQCLRCHTHYRD